MMPELRLMMVRSMLPFLSGKMMSEVRTLLLLPL